MRGPLVLLIAAIPVVTTSVYGDSSPLPTVRAEPAVVEVGSRPVGTRLLRLPDLAFPVTIENRCTEDSSVQSISISVADTRQTYRPVDFDSESTIATTLGVPHDQIGPLAVGEFCMQNVGETQSPLSLRIRDVLTANVSLRCASDARQSVVYEALVLHVELLCNSETDQSTELPENQKSSSPTRF